MTRGILLRAVALVAIAGQLQLLPAAIACVGGHEQAAAMTHCGDPIEPGTPVVGATGCHETPACQLGVGCASPTAVVSAGFAFIATGAVIDSPAGTTPVLASFDSSPAPPPPLA